MAKIGKAVSYGSKGAAAGTAIGGPIGGAIGAGLGGLFGLFSDSGEDELAQSYANADKAAKLYEGLQAPTITTGTYTPEEIAYQEILAPTLATADTGTLSARMQALEDLKNLSETGYDAETQLANQKLQNEYATENRATQDAIKQDLARRGLRSSALELVGRQAASQQSIADKNLQELNNVANLAKQKALAEQAYAQNVSSLESDLYGRSQNNANTINQFNQDNAYNTWKVKAQNAALQNEAQKYNIQNAKSDAQTNWSNKLDLLNSQANAYNAQASNLRNQAGDKAASNYDVVNSVTGAVDSLYNTAQTAKANQLKENESNAYTNMLNRIGNNSYNNAMSNVASNANNTKRKYVIGDWSFGS